ncbi:MAG: diguanylate cyclase [Actinomycetota bacterium]
MTTVEPAAEATLDLDTVVAETEDVDTLAPVALEVIRLIEDDYCSMANLSKAIMADPALATRLLKLANSAQFGQAQEVTSLERAASLIGLNTIKLLALGFTLVTKMTAERVDSTLIWRRSIATGVVAQRLAITIEPRHADEAFVAGLLSNVGKLSLADNEVYATAVDRHGLWMDDDEERAALGFTTDTLTGRLLEKWHLPTRLSQAVSARHDGSDDDTLAFLGHLLTVADAAARLMLCDEGCDEAATAYDQLRLEAASRLGLSIDQVEENLNLAKPALDELTAMFNFEVVSSSPAEIMMSAASQLTKISLNMATELAQEQQRATELEEEKNELATQASTDALTGLANRRTFDAYLQNQVAGRQRHPKDSALGLIIFDLDHFKSVNDSFGHAVGDQVLVTVGARITEGTRRNELSARVGGEEFALIVPDTSPDELAQAAERFRAMIDDEPIPTDIGLLHVTASVGAAFAVAVEGEMAGKKLYESADKALYQSKNEGRNRVTITAIS